MRTRTWDSRALVYGRDAASHAGMQKPALQLLSVTTADAAIAAAVAGVGVTRVLSYQVADALKQGQLVRLLVEHEPAAVPVNLVYPGQGRLPMKTRAFIDFAVSALRDRLIAT